MRKYFVLTGRFYPDLKTIRFPGCREVRRRSVSASGNQPSFRAVKVEKVAD